MKQYVRRELEKRTLKGWIPKIFAGLFSADIANQLGDEGSKTGPF